MYVYQKLSTTNIYIFGTRIPACLIFLFWRKFKIGLLRIKAL